MVASLIWNSCSNCSRVVAISRILVCWYWSLSSSFDLIFLSSSHFPLMCLNSFLRVSCSNAPNLTENFVQVQKVAKNFTVGCDSVANSVCTFYYFLLPIFYVKSILICKKNTTRKFLIIFSWQH